MVDRSNQSFGPVGTIKAGVMTISCLRCVFRIGGSCTHVRPAKQIPSPEDTPEWCELRADVVREANKVLREMARKQPH